MIPFLFRPLNRSEIAAENPGQLLVVPAAESQRPRRDHARLALEFGPAAFVQGSGPIEEIVLQAQPTLDDLLAASIVQRQLSGADIPSGMKLFADYVAMAREGLRPGNAPVPLSLEGVATAIRNLAGVDLTESGVAAALLRDWEVLADRIFEAAGEGIDPFQTSIVADDPRFARQRAYLQNDERLYREDVARSERWIVKLPGGPPQAAALLTKQPKSLLWKHWARGDDAAPVGGAYQLLGAKDENDRWIFSTNPVDRMPPLKPLADQLQTAELEAAGGDAQDDPWVSRHGDTLVAPPHRGSKLSDQEILGTLRRWTSARAFRDRPPVGRIWGVAASLLATAACVLFYVAPWKDSVQLRSVGPEVARDRETFGEEYRGESRLIVLGIGISNYDTPGMDLEYADDDAIELADAFATHTGVLFKGVDRKVIVGPEADAHGIIQGLLWLEGKEGEHGEAGIRRPSRNDLVVITVSGHGMLFSNGEYFVLAKDYDQRGRREGVVPWSFFQDTLDQLPCTVIVILDTCHAGASSAEGGGGERSAKVVIDPKMFSEAMEEAARRFAGNQKGILLLPACSGDQKAKETERWQHGALSKAVIEAITGETEDGVDEHTLTMVEQGNPGEGGIVSFYYLARYVEQRMGAMAQDQTVQLKCSNSNVEHCWIPLAIRGGATE